MNPHFRLVPPHFVFSGHSSEMNYITVRCNLKPVSPIYSEIELIPPSDSELENCALVESLAKVAAVIAGYIVKKVVNLTYTYGLQKVLHF